MGTTLRCFALFYCALSAGWCLPCLLALLRFALPAVCILPAFWLLPVAIDPLLADRHAYKTWCVLFTFWLPPVAIDLPADRRGNKTPCTLPAFWFLPVVIDRLLADRRSLCPLRCDIFAQQAILYRVFYNTFTQQAIP